MCYRGYYQAILHELNAELDANQICVVDLQPHSKYMLCVTGDTTKLFCMN